MSLCLCCCPHPSLRSLFDLPFHHEQLITHHCHVAFWTTDRVNVSSVDGGLMVDCILILSHGPTAPQHPTRTIYNHHSSSSYSMACIQTSSTAQDMADSIFMVQIAALCIVIAFVYYVGNAILGHRTQSHARDERRTTLNPSSPSAEANCRSRINASPRISTQ